MRDPACQGDNMAEIRIGNIVAKTQSKAKGTIRVAGRPDGTVIGIPVLVVNGKDGGPTLLVDGSCHGDEAEGGMAIIKTWQSLDPSEVKGTLIGVPTANVPAFEAQSRGNPFDRYYPDMNRVWPGKSDGSMTEMIASVYFNELLTKANYNWTMHGGGNILSMKARINVQAASPDAKSIQLAKGLGPGWDLLAVRREVLPTSLGGVCEKKGIPHITTELSGAGDRTPERWAHNVLLHVNALQNLMKHLGMTEGRAEYPKSWNVVEYSIPRFKNGGILDVLPKCNLGERVEGDEPLLRVLSLLGDEVETIRAPHKGEIIGVPICPNAYPGDMAVLVGEIARTISR